jgi:hypothetical protein
MANQRGISEVRQQSGWLSIAAFVQLSNLSDSTVRRRIRDGSIPSAQPGGAGTKLLIPADALASCVSAKPNTGTSASNDIGATPAPLTNPTQFQTTNAPDHVPARHGPQPKWQKVR